MMPLLRYLALIISLPLAGCLASAPATRLYMLSPLEDVAATSRTEPVKPATARLIVVRDVHLPGYLDRPQIVTREGGQRLNLAEFDQWGGDLREDMTRILALNLDRLLPGARVVGAPTPGGLQPDIRLDVEVLRFEREADGQVRLSARWWVRRPTVINTLPSSPVTVTVSPGGNTYAAVVAAMSVAVGDLARTMAESLRTLEGP